MAPATGLTRPLTVALSVNVPAPRVMFGDAVVAIDGVADADETPLKRMEQVPTSISTALQGRRVFILPSTRASVLSSSNQAPSA